MNTQKLVAQKTLVIEAVGTRKQIGNIVFGYMEGYYGDCAVMDEDDANELLKGEAIKEKSGKVDLPNLHKLEKSEEDPKRPRTIGSVRRRFEETLHGKKRNFALARKKPEKQEKAEKSK